INKDSSIVDRFDQLQLPNSHHVWRAVQWLQFTPRRVDHYQVLGVCSMPRHAGRLLSTNSGLAIYSTRSKSHTPYPIGIPVRDIEEYSKLQLRIELANTSRQSLRRLTSDTLLYIHNGLAVAHVGRSILLPESLYSSSATSKSYF